MLYERGHHVPGQYMSSPRLLTEYQIPQHEHPVRCRPRKLSKGNAMFHGRNFSRLLCPLTSSQKCLDY